MREKEETFDEFSAISIYRCKTVFPCEPLKSHSGQRWPMCNPSTWEAKTGDLRASYLSGLEE